MNQYEDNEIPCSMVISLEPLSANIISIITFLQAGIIIELLRQDKTNKMSVRPVKT